MKTAVSSVGLCAAFALASCATEGVKGDSASASTPANPPAAARPAPAIDAASSLPTLSPGAPVTRELRQGDLHTYVIATQPGQFVWGRVEQRPPLHVSVALVDPQGQRLVEINWVNSPPYTKLFRIHSEKGGPYRLEVRPNINGPDPFEGKGGGTYEARIDQVATAKEGAEREAQNTIRSPRLLKAWKDIRDGGPAAEDAFWQELKGKAPLVEPIPGSSQGDVLVSFVWRGNSTTRYVGLFGVGGVEELSLSRLGDSNVWFYSAREPKEARVSYWFIHADGPPLPTGGPPPPWDIRTWMRDPENPRQLLGATFLELPDAPKGPLYHQDVAPRGRFATEKLHSEKLHEDREVVIYLPPGAEAGKSPLPLLLAFDGEVYGGDTAERTAIPLPAIVDHLVSEKKLPPTVVALVPALGEKRDVDLAMSEPYADFIATEVLPLLQRKYRVDPRPESVTLTGSSLGGLASAFIACRHPKAIGNVLSQSGSYQFSPGGWDLEGNPVVEPGALVREVASAPKQAIHFYLEAGLFEGQLRDFNRHLRDVLVAKGASVTYREYAAGHDYNSWKETIATGLVALAASREKRR